jgi:hypothetical protein
MASRAKKFRFAARSWKKKHKFIPKFDNDCKFLVDLLDFFEESRPLADCEVLLRDDARAALARSIKAQAAFWKQRGKIRCIKEGDENTRFFHARATHRFRRNSVRALDVDGVQVVDHQGKALALHDFYSDLLGRARPTSWAFDLDLLYRDAPRANGPALVAPFGEKEIRAAVWGMDCASAPGPDGLGPSFYRAAWAQVAPDLARLFDAFHAGEADLGYINRAHVALLAI